MVMYTAFELSIVKAKGRSSQIKNLLHYGLPFDQGKTKPLQLLDTDTKYILLGGRRKGVDIIAILNQRGCLSYFSKISLIFKISGLSSIIWYVTCYILNEFLFSGTKMSQINFRCKFVTCHILASDTSIRNNSQIPQCLNLAHPKSAIIKRQVLLRWIEACLKSFNIHLIFTDTFMKDHER